MMKRVLILLSTYNGERFLAEQLDSLYTQEGVDIHVLVRDDRSTDNTVTILEDYQNRYGNMTVLKGENVGAGPSFMLLIKEAAENHKGYDYYAFCDQDDVWFPNKMVLGVNALEESSRERKLFFCSAIKTDVDLHPIVSYRLRQVNSFGANLVANHIMGCCMMFNGKLLEDINKINTEAISVPNGLIPLHDSWAAAVAYALDAEIIQNRAALMYYRQHGHNVIGSRQGFLSIQLSRIKRHLKNASYTKSNRCIIALQVLGSEIPEKNRFLMELVASYRENWKSKVRLLLDSRMYEYGILDNIETFIALLFNKF